MLLYLWWGLHPNIPKLKIHLIYLNYWTSQRSPACLTCVQNTSTSLQLGNYLKFHLQSNCLPLILTRSKRHRWPSYRHYGTWKHKISRSTDNTGCLSLWPCGWLGGAACCASSPSIMLHIPSRAKTDLRLIWLWHLSHHQSPESIQLIWLARQVSPPSLPGPHVPLLKLCSQVEDDLPSQLEERTGLRSRVYV